MPTEQILSEEQIAEIERELDQRREWKRGVKDCEWCGLRSADRNEHPCFIAAETSAEFAAATERERLRREITAESTTLSQSAIVEIEALGRKAAALIDNDTEPTIAALIGHVPALCQTVRALREDLKYRIEALEELRRARDGWLALLNPANPEETVGGAIRNLQQAYITERDNAETADQQLSEVTKERDELKESLKQTQDERDTARTVVTEMTIQKQRLEQELRELKGAGMP